MSRIVLFPTFNAQVLQEANAASERDVLNRRRIHLYTPTEQERAHRSLDMAAQVGWTVERVQAEIERSITAKRERRTISAVKASMGAVDSLPGSFTEAFE